MPTPCTPTPSRALFIIVNIAAMPPFSSPTSQPVAPAYSITQVGDPWSPSLCSRLTTRSAFRSPGLPSASGRLRGTRNRLIPFVPAAAARQPRQHEVHHVRQEIPVAPGDVDLLPRDRVGPVPVRLRLRAQRPHVRSRPAARSGSSCPTTRRRSASAGKARAASSEAWAASASICPCVSSGLSCSARFAPDIISFSAVASVCGSPSPPHAGPARPPRSSRPRRWRGTPRRSRGSCAPRRSRAAPDAGRPRGAAGPEAPRRHARRRSAPPPSSRRRVGEAGGRGDVAVPHDMVEEEAELLHRCAIGHGDLPRTAAWQEGTDPLSRPGRPC